MSMDLQGWYIKTSKNVEYENAKYELEVIGANHSWDRKSISQIDNQSGETTGTVWEWEDVGPRYGTADDIYTFMEQVQAVINRCSCDEDVIEAFKEKATQLEKMATQLNKPIVSEWF